MILMIISSGGFWSKWDEAVGGYDRQAQAGSCGLAQVMVMVVVMMVMVGQVMMMIVVHFCSTQRPPQG